jgi:hypothetical protein
MNLQLSYDRGIHMSKLRLRSGRLAAAGAAGLAMVVLIASPAMADTSQATASALQITLAGGGVASSGQTTASNDGTTESNTGNPSPPLSVLGAQTVFTAGVLGQPSRAFTTGVSAACAGVTSPGEAITLDNVGDCTVTSTSTVVFNLGTVAGASITLEADYIYAYCRADTTSVSGFATLGNARIVSSLTGTLLALPANPGANSSLSVPGIVSLTLNRQQSSSPGQLSVTALAFDTAAAGLASVRIGDVACGPNAVAPPVPAIPAAGVPVVAGTLAVLATGVYLWRRRRALANN